MRACAVVAAFALLVSAGARAEMDSFLLGNGHDGALSVPASTWWVINSYARLTATANAGATTIQVSTPAGFSNSGLVMILQGSSLSTFPTNGGTPIATSSERVGKYELARVSATGVGATSLTFTRPLWQSYDANVTQVITVPEYTTVTVPSTSGIEATPWNGQTGGVLAFLATGAITNDGWIGAWRAGFRGGPVNTNSSSYGCIGVDEPAPNGASKGEGLAANKYPTWTGFGYLANGGGSGICHNSGGGGGGLYGTGGLGGRPCAASGACDVGPGDYGGRGGAAVTFDPRTRFFFGGGGGGGQQNDSQGGPGGAGGGVVVIRAASMARSSTSISAGVDASASGGSNAWDAVGGVLGSDGAGGGGAGGTVSVRLTGSLDCDWVSADGAAGGDTGNDFHGPGGGGSGGIVLVQYSGTLTCNSSADSGAAGTTPNGTTFYGTAGAVGSVTTLTSAYARPPTPVIAAPVAGQTTTNTLPTITGTIPRASTPIQLFVDGIPIATRPTSGAVSPYPWSYTVTLPLSYASHTVTAQAEVAGAASLPASVQFTVTSAGPMVTINSGPANPTASTAATFTFTASDPAATFQCHVDGAAYAACSSGASYTVGQGAHTFYVRATDPMNVTGAQATYAWTVDTTGPAVSISGGPANPTNSQSASFTLTAEAGATLECALDAGAFAACTSPKPYSALPAGSHTFKAHARDTLGNLGADSTYTWTIDLTPPTVAISSGPASPTNIPSASFQFSAPDATSYECKVDAAGYAPCTSPASYSVAAGTHTFTVRGRDAAGNWSTGTSATWTVDLTAPTTSFTSTPASITNLQTANFAFSANEPGTTLQCSLDGAGWSPCTSPKSQSVAEGAHTFAVHATDPAGNTGAQASFAWTVDLTAPNTLLVSGPPPSVGMGDVTIAFSATETGCAFQCNLDSMGYVPCGAPYLVSAPMEGTHNVLIAATDPAGNPDPSPLSVSFTVDHDRDRDGLTDAEEITAGTDPGKADTDGDMLSDGAEVNTTGTSPLDDDTDDDGLLDGDEVNVSLSSPLVRDTDGDGLTDGQERGLASPQGYDTALALFAPDADPSTRTDPTKADTDGDGISDGLEDANQDGRIDPGETDPSKADTDGDGLGDLLERTAFNPTDPTKADTDGDGLKDGDEDANHNGMVDASETDPNKADTDHGGVNDGQELQGHTNPLDSSDDYQVRGGGCSSSGAALAPLALVALLGLVLRRRPALACAILAAALGSAARAQSGVPVATSIDVQQLKPAPGAGALLGLHGARVDRSFEWRGGLFTSYSDQPLVVVVPATGDRASSLVASQTTMDALFAMSFFGWLELGAAMPVSYQRSGGLPGPLGAVSIPALGTGDFRLVPKAKFLDVAGVSMAAVAQIAAPTGAANGFLGAGGFSMTPRLVVEYAPLDFLRLDFNGGVNLRPTSQLLNLSVGNELAGGLGVEAQAFGLALQLAASGALGLGQLDGSSVPVEVLGALEYHFGSFAVSAGGGLGVTHGYGAPRWRALASVTFEPGPPAPRARADLPLPPPPHVDGRPLPKKPPCPGPDCQEKDSDGDGFADATDKCPHDPETLNGYQDDDGCPDVAPLGNKTSTKKPANDDMDGDGVPDAMDLCPNLAGGSSDGCPPDDDNDGIPNVIDKCPTEKETFNGYQDDDGCPDQAPKAPAKSHHRRR